MTNANLRLETGSLAVSNDDRPYGRCYGQVCGMSYPCTQQPPSEDWQPSSARRSSRRRAK